MPLSSEDESQFEQIVGESLQAERNVRKHALLFAVTIAGIASLPFAAWTRWYFIGIFGFMASSYALSVMIESIMRSRLRRTIQRKSEDISAPQDVLILAPFVRRFAMIFVSLLLFLSAFRGLT